MCGHPCASRTCLRRLPAGSANASRRTSAHSSLSARSRTISIVELPELRLRQVRDSRGHAGRFVVESRGPALRASIRSRRACLRCSRSSGPARPSARTRANVASIVISDTHDAVVVDERHAGAEPVAPPLLPARRRDGREVRQETERILLELREHARPPPTRQGPARVVQVVISTHRARVRAKTLAIFPAGLGDLAPIP